MPSLTVGRITSRAAFAELQRSRARGSSGSVRAVFTPAPAPTASSSPTPSTPSATAGDVFPQVGFAVSRQCGSAVVRNRLRRRARAVVRSEAPQLPRGRYLLRFSPDSASASPAAFRADVAQALRKASREQGVRAR